MLGSSLSKKENEKLLKLGHKYDHENFSYYNKLRFEDNFYYN